MPSKLKQFEAHMKEKGWLDHVETEGWDLTLEQNSIIHKMNWNKMLMRRALLSVRYASVIGVALVFGMCLLQEDQTIIYETYRMMFVAAIGFGMARLLRFNQSHMMNVELHGQLMKTHPPLPGSPEYVETPEPETKTENQNG